MSGKIIGYRLVREDNSGIWLHAGTTAKDVVAIVQSEIEANEGLSVDELYSFMIEPYETTQEEIDSLPEFKGW